MIPQGSTIGNGPVLVVEQPSKTWKLDFATNRVIGRIDGLEAVQQAVFKILQTARFQHEIYSFQYGHELDSLIGTSPKFLQSEMKRILKEALTQDDRILSVDDIRVEDVGDSVLVQFTVVSTFGSFDVSKVVNP